VAVSKNHLQQKHALKQKKQQTKSRIEINILDQPLSKPTKARNYEIILFFMYTI